MKALAWLLLAVVSTANAADPANIELQKTLETLAASKSQMLQTIEKSDLEAFRAQVRQIQDALAASRTALDHAVLTGDWQAPAKKRKASSVADTLQGAQLLSLMTVAISTGYDYPTKKVPDSAADAAVRLFGRLEQLAAEVRALNTNGG